MNTFSKNTLLKAHNLVGTVLAGEWIESEIMISGVPRKIRNQKISEESYKMIEEVIGTTRFRIIRAGGVYTQDIRSDRFNFRVDDSFIITEAYVG